MQNFEIILEPSTNTHILTTEGVEPKVVNLPDLSGLKITNFSKNGIVTHGEHGLIVTESRNIIKLTQQEFNPVTQILQNSWD
jgi:hypothetical protein